MTTTVEEEGVEFDSAENPDRAVPKIFAGGPGLRMRLWEFDEWTRQFGHFGSYGASHGWHCWELRHADEREYCNAMVMTADLRCNCDTFTRRDELEPCSCVGDLVYRGVCTYCDWEAEHFWDDENTAAEDALDHAWPGWRDLPVLDEPPNEYGSGKAAAKKKAAWCEKAEHLYPPGWIAQGGPIKTWREYMATRHVPGRSGFGGYDVGVLREGALERWEQHRKERDNARAKPRGNPRRAAKARSSAGAKVAPPGGLPRAG